MEKGVPGTCGSKSPLRREERTDPARGPPERFPSGAPRSFGRLHLALAVPCVGRRIVKHYLGEVTRDVLQLHQTLIHFRDRVRMKGLFRLSERALHGVAISVC